MQEEVKTSNTPQEVEKVTSPQVLVNELWASGTKIFGGWIMEEYNPELTGWTGLKKYDEMRKSDAQIFATLLAMELPIRSTLWSIEPGETEQADGEYIITDQDYIISNFVEKALFEKMEITWDDFLRQVLTMLPFGFSLFEKVFKFDGDKIVLKKLAQRLPWSIMKWETADHQAGVQQSLWTQAPNGNSMPSIPADKLVRFTFRQEWDNYEGVSVLRSAYKHWFIKDALYKFDAVKHERQSVWIPVITMPKGATAADKAEAEAILENLSSTESTYIVLPGEDWKFEFADLKAGTQSKMDESIAHHNREISKNILAQFLELWASGAWSYALSEDQSSLFLLSLTAIAKQIAEKLNRDLIKQLVDLNFTLSENQSYPKLKYNKLGEVDYTKLSSALSTLAGGGLITPDEDLEDYLRDVFDLPKKLEEDTNEMENSPEDEMEDTNEMETAPENMTSEDQDQEIAQMEQQLADLEANELQILTQNELIRFSENEALHFATVSQETKDKISEALKEYWKRKGGKSNEDLKGQRDSASQQLDKARTNIGNARDEFATAAAPVKADIERLKSLKASIPKGKAGKPQRDAFNQKLKEVRANLAALTKQRQEKMATLQSIRSQAFKSRVEANKELKARKQELKKYLDGVRSKLNEGKLSAKQVADNVNAKVSANSDKIAELRKQVKAAWKDKDKKEALRTLIAWIQDENKTYKAEVKQIKTDFANKKADTQAKIAEVKKQAAFKELGFADEAEALAFQEARNTFNIYDILKIQNYGNK